MKRLRIYADASVIGGCLDPEFSGASKALIAMARGGEVTLLVSPLLLTELRQAPAEVQSVLASVPVESIEEAPLTREAENLREAYLRAEVVGPSSSADAHHVALATVARADLIVSWNFKHMVHFEKMRGFNAVNLREGYTAIEIHSPLEVV